uniref:Uncharacterized protein n=1 Tax=Desulfacinum infernum TaxID=35837 RepID=A0A832E9E6_9BACT
MEKISWALPPVAAAVVFLILCARLPSGKGFSEGEAFHGTFQKNEGYEQLVCWSSGGCVDLKVHQQSLSLHDTTLVMAWITWDPAYSVELPSLDLFPPELRVVREQIAGPKLLDNRRLEAIWGIELEPLQVGPMTIPELPWVLLALKPQNHQSLSYDHAVETIRTSSLTLSVSSSQGTKPVPQELGPPCGPVALSEKPWNRLLATAALAVGLIGTVMLGLIVRIRRRNRSPKRSNLQISTQQAALLRLTQARAQVYEGAALSEPLIVSVERVAREFLANLAVKRPLREKGKGTVYLLDSTRNTLATLRHTLEDLISCCEQMRFNPTREFSRQSRNAETFIRLLDACLLALEASFQARRLPPSAPHGIQKGRIPKTENTEGTGS